jgi:hypothetical protein
MNIKHVSQKIGGVIALLASTLAISIPAYSATLIGNYSSVSSSAVDGSLNEIRFSPAASINTLDRDGFPITITAPERAIGAAVGFTVPSTSNYALNNITLRLLRNPLTVDLNIYEDSSRTSSNPRGAVLQTVEFNNPSIITDGSGFNNSVFVPQTPFTFQAGSKYWVELLPNQVFANNLFWSGNFVSPTGDAVFNDYQNFERRGPGIGNYTQLLSQPSFNIDATPQAVPFEFSPVGGLVILAGAWLGRKQLKKQSVK